MTKSAEEIKNNMTDEEMIFNLHQIQHILNELINGKTLNGSQLNSDKLIEYKISVIKILDKQRKE